MPYNFIVIKKKIRERRKKRILEKEKEREKKKNDALMRLLGGDGEDYLRRSTFHIDTVFGKAVSLLGGRGAANFGESSFLCVCACRKNRDVQVSCSCHNGQ
jgi:hypothetical protein